MQRGATALLSSKDPLLALYAFVVGLLALKMFILAIATGAARKIKKVTPNAEGNEVIHTTDQTVERIQRAHMNDLENVPIFLFVALAYIHTQPHPLLCHWLFWLFTAARYLHGLVYTTFPQLQPIRTLLFLVGLFITVFMIFANFMFFINFM